MGEASYSYAVVKQSSIVNAGSETGCVKQRYLLTLLIVRIFATLLVADRCVTPLYARRNPCTSGTNFVDVARLGSTQYAKS